MKKYISLFLAFGILQLHAQQPAVNKKQQGQLTEAQKKMLQQAGINRTDPQKALQQMKSMYPAGAQNAFGSAVPEKDAKRIAKVDPKLLTKEELLVLIGKLHAAIEKRLKGFDLKELNIFYRDIQKENKGTNVLANAASGCMIIGDIDPAIWLMGKACIDNPDEPYILNDYAAFLTMCGAPEYAIPILNRLNKDHPNNSAILNNIGQAWFGLGELGRAQKYLDSAMQINPNNPQATATASLIAEHDGNVPNAILLIKNSIRNGFSEEKNKRLTALGSSLTKKDLGIPAYAEGDTLGLNKILALRPKHYYYSVEARYEMLHNWSNYGLGCFELKNALINEQAAWVSNDNKQDQQTDNDPKFINRTSFLYERYVPRLLIAKDEFNAFSDSCMENGATLGSEILEIVNNAMLEAAKASGPAACNILLEAQQKLFKVQHKLEDHDTSTILRSVDLLNQFAYYARMAQPEYKTYILDKLTAEIQLLELAHGWQLSTAPFDININSVNSNFIWEGITPNCPATVPQFPVIPVALPAFNDIKTPAPELIIPYSTMQIRFDSTMMKVKADTAFMTIHERFMNNWVKDKNNQLTSMPMGAMNTTASASNDNAQDTPSLKYEWPGGVIATVGFIPDASGVGLSRSGTTPKPVQTSGLTENMSALIEMNTSGVSDLQMKGPISAGPGSLFIWMAGHSAQTIDLLKGLVL